MSSDVIKQGAFVKGKIIHQGTGKPIVGKIRITAQEGPVVDKILDDGTFVLSGDVERLFPKLATQDYQLNLNIHADSPQFRQGFIEKQEQVTIPQNSTFDPLIDKGTIALPPDPVNIRGRVVEAENPDTPISGVTVELRRGGTVTNTATTNSDGRYRFDNITVLAPAEIQCLKTGFKTEKRTLAIDFGKLVNEGNFRLAP